MQLQVSVSHFIPIYVVLKLLQLLICIACFLFQGSQKMLFDDSAQRQLNNLRKQTCTVSCEFAKNVSILDEQTSLEHRV